MPDAKLRFWSLCTGESRVTTRTPDCLADHQVLDRSGRDYTVVVSRRADRPPNARPHCGVAWLDWGNRGDGAGDRDYGLLIMRNMLASPDFAQAIQRVDRPGHEREVMGGSSRAATTPPRRRSRAAAAQARRVEHQSALARWKIWWRSRRAERPGGIAKVVATDSTIAGPVIELPASTWSSS